MKAFIINIAIDRADTTQQRQALLALRDPVAAAMAEFLWRFPRDAAAEGFE